MCVCIYSIAINKMVFFFFFCEENYKDDYDDEENQLQSLTYAALLFLFFPF